jgi:hypothetical protein
MLTRVPLRRANLTGLRLDVHLQRGGRGRVVAILIGPGETKDNDPIAVSVAPGLAETIDERVRRFRPAVAAGDCACLFPLGTCLGDFSFSSLAGS